MQRPNRFRWFGLLLLLAVAAALILLVWPAASPSEPAAQAEQPATAAHPTPAQVAMVADTAAEPATEAEAPAETGQTDAPVAATPSSDTCIACHTNQQLLEQLAEEPVVVESEMAAGEG